jgi:hypothetical protein
MGAIMWKRKRKTEFLPWYRAPGYKGNLTEAQKRELDSFRAQETHPAANYDSLPTEAQHYINRLELQIYDDKQQQIAGAALVVMAFGALTLYLTYFGAPEPTAWRYVAGGLCLVVPWFVYSYYWKKNAKAFMPEEPYAASPTDEGLRLEWEIEYLSHRRREQADRE